MKYLLLLIPSLSFGASVQTSTPTFGTASLDRGSVSVVTGAIQSDSFITLTPSTATAQSGNLFVADRIDGVGFSIKSTSSEDTREVSWLISTPQKYIPAAPRVGVSVKKKVK